MVSGCPQNGFGDRIHGDCRSMGFFTYVINGVIILDVSFAPGKVSSVCDGITDFFPPPRSLIASFPLKMSPKPNIGKGVSSKTTIFFRVVSCETSGGVFSTQVFQGKCKTIKRKIPPAILKWRL